MTGRYYRGGRGGRGGGQKPSPQTKPESKKKSIDDYYFYVGSSKQASDFEITAEYAVNHIKKTFDRGNDIAEALRTLKPTDVSLWKPTLVFSTKTDAKIATPENRQHELEYKADLDEFMRRKRAYNDNLYKAYALVWERCAKAMQNKIEFMSNYTVDIYNDPIELLKAIKHHMQ
jgi:hypothetical protein